MVEIESILTDLNRAKEYYPKKLDKINRDSTEYSSKQKDLRLDLMAISTDID